MCGNKKAQEKINCISTFQGYSTMEILTKCLTTCALASLKTFQKFLIFPLKDVVRQVSDKPLIFISQPDARSLVNQKLVFRKP
jgi:phosphatidylserine decarboxylase